jgi:hypothetical protein
MMIHGLNPGKVKNLFLLQTIQASSGVHTASHSKETGVLFPGDKAIRRNSRTYL